MTSCSCVEITSVTSKPGKEKGSECNEKLLMKTYVLSTFLYESEAQWLSTPSAGEPGFRVLDTIIDTFKIDASNKVIASFSMPLLPIVPLEDKELFNICMRQLVH